MVRYFGWAAYLNICAMVADYPHDTLRYFRSGTTTLSELLLTLLVLTNVVIFHNVRINRMILYINVDRTASASFLFISNSRIPIHNDVIKWKISRVTGPLCKGQWRPALTFSFICALNKQFCKQSWRWWFDTPLRSLWRYKKRSQNASDQK